MKNILLTSEDDIKTYSNLNDNTDGKYITPAIYMAQKSDLEGCIGTPLVRKLQQLIATNQLDDIENEYYKELLDDYISDFLAYATIVRLIPVVSFKIGNAGVIRTDEEKVVNMPYDEVFNLADYYKNQADYLMYRMQKYLIANYNKFPELTKYKSVEDIRANLYSAASVPIWLGGKRNPK